MTSIYILSQNNKIIQTLQTAFKPLPYQVSLLSSWPDQDFDDHQDMNKLLVVDLDSTKTFSWDNASIFSILTLSEKALKAEYSLLSPKDHFTFPLRLGNLLDRIEHHATVMERLDHLDSILIGPFDFVPAENVLQNKKNQSLIRLTEKERNILVYLYKNKDQPVSRADLLKNVWEYAEGLETHTVETHIYRLRQKIEKDASKPKILVTKDEGYLLT